MNARQCSRRAVVLTALGVAGCAISDPTIKGGPAAGATATPTASPTRDALWAPVADAFRALEGHAAACVAAGPALAAPPEFAARYASCGGAFAAHLSRLRHVDPLDSASDVVDSEPSPTSEVAPASTAAADERFLALLSKAQSETAELFEQFGSHPGPDAQPLALTALSLHLTATGARTPTARFTPGKAAPIRFAPTTPGASQGVVLTQLWSAIYAYEVGLGILSAREALAKDGLTRLAELKQRRDDVTATIRPENRPEQLPAYDLGGTPDSLASIRTIWAGAEHKLLDAWCRLAAASTDAEAKAAAIAQTGRVVALGGALSAWPGWV